MPREFLNYITYNHCRRQKKIAIWTSCRDWFKRREGGVMVAMIHIGCVRMVPYNVQLSEGTKGRIQIKRTRVLIVVEFL